jgi:hypothetical protein
VEEMITFDKTSGLFIVLKVAKTDQTTLLGGQSDTLFTLDSNSNESVPRVLNSENAWSIGNILLASYRWLGRAEEC